MADNTAHHQENSMGTVVRLGLASGVAMYLSEVCRLTQSVDIFHLNWQVFLVLGVYLLVPLAAIAIGSGVARIRALQAARGGLIGLVALLFVLATASVMLWVDGEATLVSRRWRFLIGLTPGIGLPVLVVFIHRKWRPELTTWVYGAVAVWCLSIAATRIFRDLALDLYNFRWFDFGAGVIHGVFLLLCALLCWLWLRMVVLRWRRALLILAVFSLSIPLVLSNLGASKTIAQSKPTRDGDIFFIILDSLRGDHTSAKFMPNLAKLASRGVRFVDAHSPSINTTYSLPMLLDRDIGAQRAMLRTRFNSEAPDFNRSLPGRLQNSGYEIHLLSDYAHTSLSALEIYRWDSVATLPMYGQFRLPILHRLLGAFLRRDRAAMKKLRTGKYPFGPGGFAEVLERRLKASKGPGFYLIHLAVPHAPYNVSPYRTETLPSPSEEETNAINDRFRLESGDNVDVAGRKKMYRLAVRAGDEQLGAIFETIKRSTRAQHSLVVVTSDHGEPFGEHGSVGHGRSLYNGAHHVPLVLAGPDYSGGRAPSTPVSGSQLPATILEWAGLERSERSLSRPPKASDAMAVWHPRGTVIQNGGWRLIWTQQRHVLSRPKSWAHRDELELYDMSQDPDERNNLVSAKPPALKRLLKAITTHWRIPEASRKIAQKRHAQ